MRNGADRWGTPLPCQLPAVIRNRHVNTVPFTAVEHCIAQFSTHGLARFSPRLWQRSRVASDLHDSVGHTLSVVTLQASAAARVLDSDPAFARQALKTIEESTRSALNDLDTALGALRGTGDEEADAPPGLTHLDQLLRSTNLAGLTVRTDVVGELTRTQHRLATRRTASCGKG